MCATHLASACALTRIAHARAPPRMLQVGCPQLCDLPPHTCPKVQSEDCLVLNVFTPRLAAMQAPAPVRRRRGRRRGVLCVRACVRACARVRVDVCVSLRPRVRVRSCVRVCARAHPRH